MNSARPSIHINPGAALVLALILLAQVTTSLAQSSSTPGAPVAITIGQELSLHSKILQEDRSYLVYLPQSYGNKELAPKRYPVLYLLDGEAHFQSASGVVQFWRICRK